MTLKRACTSYDNESLKVARTERSRHQSENCPESFSNPCDGFSSNEEDDVKEEDQGIAPHDASYFLNSYTNDDDLTKASSSSFSPRGVSQSVRNDVKADVESNSDSGESAMFSQKITSSKTRVSLNTESKEERRNQDKFDKEAAKHEQPDYDEKFFNVHIKLLQTDRRNKNVLTLSRSVVKTLQCKLNRDHFEEESDEFFQKPLDFLFHLICSAIRFIHDKIDEDNIEGTTGIWQVNLAAGFVIASKEGTTTSLLLVNDVNQLVKFSSTKYQQGRNTAIYGPPYNVTIGIPSCSSLGSAILDLKEQETFLCLIEKKEIVLEDIIGSSHFLTTMINGGSKVETLAWNEAHLKLMLSKNKKCKAKIVNDSSYAVI